MSPVTLSAMPPTAGSLTAQGSSTSQTPVAVARSAAIRAPVRLSMRGTGEVMQRPSVGSGSRRLSVRAAAEETTAEVAQEEAPKRLKWWEKDMHPNMVDIDSMEHFLEQMSGAGERLVIVDFYAHWCHACRGLYPRLARLMKDNPDILLLKVEFDSNKTITKSLGIKVLPYFHFYRGSKGKVAAFSASLKKLDRLKDAIETHNGPMSNLESVVYHTIEELVETKEENGVKKGDKK
uniref:Thioredoxin domain-containing protein n=1 Tax=Tetraselmis chuii TaxID=63592 RepID=A0A6U1GQG8_9CHLO|mmetsp:Transcript_24462/g.43533  ORF Transcript_24462/g.43533 Transcript_24462/m.43533 type:complete len:235 (+) Transcript_24462:171-875(+)